MMLKVRTWNMAADFLTNLVSSTELQWAMAHVNIGDLLRVNDDHNNGFGHKSKEECWLDTIPQIASIQMHVFLL